MLNLPLQDTRISTKEVCRIIRDNIIVATVGPLRIMESVHSFTSLVSLKLSNYIHLYILCAVFPEVLISRDL
jgi:hypothetical protein